MLIDICVFLGPGGRDSPRGPPQAGGDNNTWQSVPAKGRSVPSAPVDASKFRLTKVSIAAMTFVVLSIFIVL